MEKIIATIVDTTSEEVLEQFIEWAENDSTQMIQIKSPEDNEQ